MLKVKLGDILEIKRGMSLSGEYYSTEGKYIRLTLGNFCYPASGWKYNTSKEDLYFTGYVRDEYILEKGDIITPLTEQVRGLLGNTATIPQSDTYIQSGDIGLVIPNEEKINKRFSYYLLSSKVVKKQLDAGSQQTKIRHTSPDAIKSCVAFIPDVENQKKIARLLDVVNDKIEYNIKINDNLAAMAYDIYMHTFFSKKPNAKLKDILTEAEKSSIQVGEAKTSNGKYPFFTSGSTILKWNEPFVDGRNCFLNTGGNADVKFYVGKAAYSTDTWSVSAKSEMSDYLYLMLFSIKPELDKKFFQGTGLKHLQKPLLKDRPIYVPEKMELETFNRQVMPMFDIISENTRENQQLTSLRDWLLPMLMNGQATISD